MKKQENPVTEELDVQVTQDPSPITNDNVYFAKTREVQSPARGNSAASGIDMFVPTFDREFYQSFIEKNPDISTLKPDNFEYVLITFGDGGKGAIFLAPGARIVIPSGIIWKGKDGLSMNMHNKSGVATKKGLVYSAEVVDKDYIGETHIGLINTSNFIIKISEGEKIIQILQEPVILDTPIECALEEVINIETERGDNWQGSTNEPQTEA